VSTSIVNAGLLHTSYAWIHADGSEPDWGHVDGEQFGLSPYYRLYRCAVGGWVFLAAVTDEAQAKLRAILPDAPAGDDPEPIASWLSSYFESAVATEAFHALDDGGVPIEVVDEYFCRTLFDDPEARSLNLVSETWSTSVGRFEDPGLLVNISPAEAIVQRGPCACGEQSREILLELGYSSSDVDAMVEGRAVLDGAT
jgi:crotonobetainyl-CoA:carnitine CoA-transferase CaiB-like acyl-CoA transferase